MCILESRLYLQDIERVSKSLGSQFPSDKIFLITGATGLICSVVVDILVYLKNKYGLNWKIICAVRNSEKAKNRFSYYLNEHNISFIDYDASRECDFPDEIDYFIHGAGNAFPAAFSEKPVETLYSNVFGLQKILTYAMDNNSRVLYISSSEVYGQLQSKEPIKEHEYGYVDLLNPRSAYPMGKRASETLCASFIKEYNVDCVIVRPGHIYGPTASKQDNRVSSSFMYDAANGKDLILKSKGDQVRSYCYCLDCASAILTILFKGKTGEAYNISNKTSLCSIKEMAESFAKAGNVSLTFDIPTENEKRSFNQMLNSSLNSDKLELLGWQAVFTKQEGFVHSVKIIQEIS